MVGPAQLSEWYTLQIKELIGWGDTGQFLAAHKSYFNTMAVYLLLFKKLKGKLSTW